MEGTPEEQGNQHELAKNYFKKIIEMRGKPGALYNYALKFEKLNNWNDDPKTIEDSFKIISKNKESKFETLIRDIKNVKSSAHFMKNYDWDKFIDKSKSGNVTEYEIEKFRKAIDKERLLIKASLPDHFREAVLYIPDLAEEAEHRVDNNYFMKGPARSRLRRDIHQERIDQFEAVEKKYNKNRLRVIPA